MVYYCCVKGCPNNTNRKKKDPNSMLSFHAFPCNPDLKSNWLKAIGRQNWKPSSYSRICSAHFSSDEINHESFRIRIKDNACPINYLPPNSNFEMSHLKVCRICLATDLKMYSLKDEKLNSCFMAIKKNNERNHLEGMPQTICYECRACLIKCNSLLEKSMIAQATLMDIFAKHGQITIDLINEQDRRQLNLKSFLSCCKVTNEYKIYSDTEDNVPSVNDNNVKKENYCLSEMYEVTVECKTIDKGEENQYNDNVIEFKHENSSVVDVKSNGRIKNEYNEISIDSNRNDNAVESNDEDDSDDDKDCDSVIDDVLKDHDPYLVKEKKKGKKVDNCKKLEKKIEANMKKNSGLTPSEIKIQKYFDIVKLSLKEQVKEWKKDLDIRKTSETIFECKICSRKFATIKKCQEHVHGHDNSCGEEECPVCKLRFKTKANLRKHRSRTHEKKFYCKICPKSFTYLFNAKRHNRWHSKRPNKLSFSSDDERVTQACVRCGITFWTDRELNQHMTTAHKDQTEIKISEEYRCEQCNVNFVTEGAKRVHLLTTNHFNMKQDIGDKSSSIDSTVKNTCRKCGEQFASFKELRTHTKSAHFNARRKSTKSLPTDSYPTLCEHCGETVNNRKEHWWHYLRKHPKEKHLYQAVITAVCETCGKGFQSSTHLRIHELRHGRPTVKCSQCPRLFYDKWAMLRHKTVHEAATPYSCTTCGRAFKFKGNLERHLRVHTNDTPYECSLCYRKFKYTSSMNLHIRTVHYKIPLPPRNKRKNK